MRNKVLFVFTFCLIPFALSAQNPEQVVRHYISVLNEWLASPYDYDRRQNVVNILTDVHNGDCTMTDEIVTKYNNNEGNYRCRRDTYLSILSEKTQKKQIRVQILEIKDVEYQSDKDIVTATLKYSGEISMTTDTEFWIYNNNKIGYIDKGRSKQKETEIIERVIEKEKVVQVESSDKNTGKAYLILKISEPNAEVVVDDDTYKVNDREFKINLTYGHHNVSVSKSTFGTVYFSVYLTGEPIERIITLKSATVEMLVEKDYDANLFVDGINYGKNNNKVSVSADQRHTIRIEKDGHTKSKTVKAYQKDFTVVMPRFSSTQVVQNNWFFGCTFSPNLMSGGISFGKCKRVGFILNGGFSKLAFTNWHNRNTEKGNLLDTFRISDLNSISTLKYNLTSESIDKGLYRSYIRIGPMFRIFNFMYMYSTVGCGTYAEVKSYDDKLYAPTIHNGFEGEAGIMVKIRRFALSFGYTQNIDRDNQFSDYHLGIHYWMKGQNYNNSTLNNRWFVGYVYSPSAQYGLSLGFSLGYYKHLGFLINGGFSNFGYSVWDGSWIDPKDDFHARDMFRLDKVLIVSSQSEEWKNSFYRGKYRTYLRIGPLVRINNILSYYGTIGYGSYANIREYSQLVYATKKHKGWDGEIGFMLKFGRVGFSLGYQHNIGIYNLFQDINAGIQIWLGR